MALKMLILDEADLLLDLGFRKDMESIVDCLPRRRQSLLFSATILKVKQSYLLAPHDVHLQIVYHLLKEHTLQMPDYKMGIPFDTEQYIHRLGRTGQEGKEGEGIQLVAPWEEYFLSELKNLPLEKRHVPRMDLDSKLKIENSMAKIDSSIKEGAYHAWLGYYNSIREIDRDKTTLVELSNKFSDSIGLQKRPSLFRTTAVKIGLRDIPGIKLQK